MNNKISISDEPLNDEWLKQFYKTEENSCYLIGGGFELRVHTTFSGVYWKESLLVTLQSRQEFYNLLKGLKLTI